LTEDPTEVGVQIVLCCDHRFHRAICSASTTTSVRMWSATDRPTMQRLEHVEDGGAVDLPFARLFGDVGAPQPVRRVGDEAPFEEGVVVHGRRRADTCPSEPNS
jgi:hypothetical protein